MTFYYNALGKDGFIEVFQDGKLFLRVKQANYFRTYYTFIKNDKVIFKCRSTYFAFWRRVKILFQDLPIKINAIEAARWNETELNYGNTILRIKGNGLFRKKMWFLYIDNLEIGYVEWAKAISVGGKYNFHINSEDYTVNSYFLILFAASIPATS